MVKKGGGKIVANEILKRTLRLKPNLDKLVRENAEELGVSVNAYIVMVLTKEVSGKEG